MSGRKRTNQPYQIKGVDALFGGTDQTETEDRHLATADIVPFEQQPRRYFDPEKLNQLVESIKQHGILEPLLVRSSKDGKYEIVAGERRYRAATMLGLTEVPVVIRNFNDQEALQVALIENLQREDLNPIEETEGILELVALRLQKDVEYVITLLNQAAHPERNAVDNVIHKEEWQVLQKVFATVGRFTPESFRTNRLPLLNLPTDILNALREGKLAYTKARAIARVKDEAQRHELLATAIKEELSLVQIKERIVTSAKVNSVEAPVTSLKTRFESAYKRIKNSKVWDSPKQKKTLEKLLETLEQLVEQD
ncbi:ParB/RepB/Spo0J family partition protein [Leptolyngbya sp. FACHB-321]|uniref:ParB/RepB/Spo0J family partition protein n=1 Tax=Leptolyngbya sp. FACHB-321 TaxID=2692807 RepID=UPI0016837B69|nr:ParB/RepB/Spo0J family partition protein [Leptolyngbya sp. FACHB-321]MBD2037733.1 ParB/RepB/Spo0J family partition protein [Leptolyngbya sp. FACHB-321]